MVYSQSPSLVRDLEDLSLDGRARDLDAGRSDRRMEMPSSNSPMGVAQSSGRKDVHVARERPSVGRRPFRSFVRFVIAILIGVGGTLAWQSYGDTAREMLAVRAPGLAAVLPPSMKSALAATSAASMDQLAPIASNLASSLEVIRRSLDQMAARQDQMAQTIAALQAADEDIRQKFLSAAPVQQPASVLQPRPIMTPPVQSASVPRRPAPAAPPR
jgi:hypothetical protein